MPESTTDEKKLRHFSALALRLVVPAAAFGLGALAAAWAAAPLFVSNPLDTPKYEWMPLDAAEIADSHPCFVGVPELKGDIVIVAICAGGKRIDTGFRFSAGRAMQDVDPKLPDNGSMANIYPKSDFTAIIESTVDQKEELRRSALG